MRLDQFIHLVMTQSLYVRRIDQLDDKWEGTSPQGLLDRYVFADQESSSAPEDPTKLLNNLYYINCWHRSDYESAALWKLYAEHAGIAIRTTIGDLKKSLSGVTRDVYIGAVEYNDYKHFKPSGHQLGNWFWIPFSKRREFEHEREVRVLYYDYPKNHEPEYEDRDSRFETPNPGQSIPIQLEHLIKSVILAPPPYAAPWLVDPLKELLTLAGLLDIAVTQSTLFDAP